MAWDRQINIKSAHELEIMREAGRINAEALQAVALAVKPGVTTDELNEVAESILKKYGAYSPFKNYQGPYPYPKSICVSVDEQLVHGIPSRRKLVEGEIVSVDCGTVYQGYVGDSALTVAVGEVDSQAQKLIDATRESLFAGIAQLQAGNRLGDVGAAVQRVAEAAGFHVTREYTGHGVGRRMHEGPQVPNFGIPGSGMLLKAGMTIALEPMVLAGTALTEVTPDEWTVVSKDGSKTAHFEHTVAITEAGPRILTQLADGSNPWDILDSSKN